MTAFNKTEKNTTKTTSYEGGVVYEKSLEDEWSNMLFSFLLQPGKSGFYESHDEAMERYIQLTENMLSKYSPEFVGRAAAFSRNVLGLRSISQLTAAMLNKYQWETKRQFYAKYFHRPDDVGEVFSAVDMLKGKRSHALVRGASDYLSSLDEYHVGKYKLKKHTYNLFDLINLTHATSDAIDKYKSGTLESPDTWEVKISTSSPEEKEQEWKRLVEERKLGYLALIRNLRNICSCDFAKDAWANEYLNPQLTNEEKIRKSLVFPYQIYVAWKTAADFMPISVESALVEAFMLSTKNFPKFSGNTLILLDVSASMESEFNKGNLTIKEVSAVYAAALYFSQDPGSVEFMKFGTSCKWFNQYSEFKNVFKLIKQMCKNDRCGYGTEIVPCFEALNKHYDRIFVFSDMQVMDGKEACWYYRSSLSANEIFSKYESKYGNTKLYSFDLGNYHTQLVPQNKNIQYVTALNDTVFKALEFLDSGKSLIDIIKIYAA